MTSNEVKHIINRVVNDHPEHIREISNMLYSFNHKQLEEYARIAKLYGGY